MREIGHDKEALDIMLDSNIFNNMEESFNKVVKQYTDSSKYDTL